MQRVDAFDPLWGLGLGVCVCVRAEMTPWNIGECRV